MRVRQRWVGKSTASTAVGKHGPCRGQGAAQTSQLPHTVPAPRPPRQSQIPWLAGRAPACAPSQATQLQLPAPQPRATVPRVQPCSRPMGSAAPHAQGAELPPVCQLPRPAPARRMAQCPRHGDTWHGSETKGSRSNSASEAWKPHCSCSRAPDRNNIPAHTSRICCRDTGLRVGWDRILQLGPGPFLANRTACHSPTVLPVLLVPGPTPLPRLPNAPWMHLLVSLPVPARPCLFLASPGELPTSSTPPSCESFAAVYPGRRRRPAPQPRCCCSPQPLVWVRMTQPVSAGRIASTLQALKPAALQFHHSAAPIPAANHT